MRTDAALCAVVRAHGLEHVVACIDSRTTSRREEFVAWLRRWWKDHEEFDHLFEPDR